MRATNPVEERVIALIEPAATERGYRLVRIRLQGNRRKTLQIMAERISDGQLSPQDCGTISRSVAELLEEVEYDTLEVSSPGIDRPLMRIEDFERFIGHEARVESAAMVDGRRRFRGMIKAVEGQNIVLQTPEGDVKLPFSSLAEARLVMTDRLIEDDLKRAKAEVEARDEEDKRKTS